MKQFNKITNTGVGIMLFGVFVGFAGLIVDVAFVFSSSNIGVEISTPVLLIMFSLWALGAMVGFAGIFWEYYHD